MRNTEKKEYKPTRNKLPNRDAENLRIRFYEWLREKPRAARKYRTQRAWAMAHDVREETVSRWKHNPPDEIYTDSRAAARYLKQIMPLLRAVIDYGRL